MAGPVGIGKWLANWLMLITRPRTMDNLALCLCSMLCATGPASFPELSFWHGRTLRCVDISLGAFCEVTDPLQAHRCAQKTLVNADLLEGRRLRCIFA